MAKYGIMGVQGKAEPERKNLALLGMPMYKTDRNRQRKFTDFNQSGGMIMNPDNIRMRKTETIP